MSDAQPGRQRDNRARWFALLAVPLVLLGALAPVVFPPPCSVTRSAHARIEPGMTRARVEAILGGPPGDYRTLPVESYLGSGGGVSWDIWQGDEGESWVCFEGGLVRTQMFQQATPVHVGPVERLLWRLDRFKARWLP